MEVNRLDPSALQTTVQSDVTVQRKRRDLHNVSTFERGQSHVDLSALRPRKAEEALAEAVAKAEEPVRTTLPDGTELELPRLTAEQRAGVDNLMSRIAAEKREAFILTCRRFGAALFAEARTNPGTTTLSSATAELRQSAQLTYEQVLPTTGNIDHEKAISDTLFGGMMGAEQQVYSVLAQLDADRKLAEEMRTDVAELKEMLSSWPDGTTQTFTYNELVEHADGTKSLQKKTVTLSKEEAEALLNKLEKHVDHLGNLTVGQQMLLQNMVHDYQQAMTTLSNVMKTWEDNLRNIIGNVK